MMMTLLLLLLPYDGLLEFGSVYFGYFVYFGYLMVVDE